MRKLLHSFAFDVLVCLVIVSPALTARATTIADNQSLNDKITDKSPIDQKTATFAGGCFWCMEPPFDKLKGVISTTSGYTDGHKNNPSYREVSSGHTGHTEAVQIVFDANQISFQELLEIFWKNIDPTVKDQQFCDKGNQYRSGIFYHDEKQKILAEKSKQALINSKKFKTIYTQISKKSKFYPAEDYHQNYYLKNPIRYKYYRYSCGRDNRLEELWSSSEK